MARKKGKRLKLLKGEKLLYVIILLLVVAIPVVNVFSKAMVSESNIEVESLKAKIEKQSRINESLEMQINELASIEKIQQVAKEKGLSYNDDNVKVIGE